MGKSYFFFVLFFLPNQASGGLFGPVTFDECVQAGLKDVHTDTALRALYSTCQNQFGSGAASTGLESSAILAGLGILLAIATLAIYAGISTTLKNGKQLQAGDIWLAVFVGGIVFVISMMLSASLLDHLNPLVVLLISILPAYLGSRVTAERRGLSTLEDETAE